MTTSGNVLAQWHLHPCCGMMHGTSSVNDWGVCLFVSALDWFQHPNNILGWTTHQNPNSSGFLTKVVPPNPQAYKQKMPNLLTLRMIRTSSATSACRCIISTWFCVPWNHLQWRFSLEGICCIEPIHLKSYREANVLYMWMIMNGILFTCVLYTVYIYIYKPKLEKFGEIYGSSLQ